MYGTDVGRQAEQVSLCLGEGIYTGEAATPAQGLRRVSKRSREGTTGGPGRGLEPTIHWELEALQKDIFNKQSGRWETMCSRPWGRGLWGGRVLGRVTSGTRVRCRVKSQGHNSGRRRFTLILPHT